MTDLIKEKLRIRREYIRENPEYYGTRPPSKNRDYIAYKKQLLSN
jgi:hypothetical protein